MLADAGALVVLAGFPAAAMFAADTTPRSPCSCSSGGCARTFCSPSAVRSPADSASPFRLQPSPVPQHHRPAAPSCGRQLAPRGTLGTYPAASRARTCPALPVCPTGPAPANVSFFCLFATGTPHPSFLRFKDVRFSLYQRPARTTSPSPCPPWCDVTAPMKHTAGCRHLGFLNW
jgi:hypothetical protein